VSLAEVQVQQLAVHADGTPFPEHCSIDFNGLGKAEIEKKAKQLVSVAVARGWLFQQTA
jgi:hypothetical protein